MQASLQAIQASDDEQTILSELAGKGNPDDIIPRLARDRRAMHRIEHVVRSLKTSHDLILGDARAASALAENSIHLVVTSPPYWTLKRTTRTAGAPRGLPRVHRRGWMKSGRIATGHWFPEVGSS